MPKDLAELDKILECGICLGVVCDPKQLTCNHSFCRSCLDKILNFRPNGSATIKCPNGCAKETVLSATQTTNDLEINFMLKSVSDWAVEDGEQQKRGEKCSMTWFSSCPRIPTKYCTKCSQFRCDMCDDMHEDKADPDKAKFSDSFIAVAFPRRVDSTGVIICNEHKSEATHLCCETQFICTYCVHRDPCHSKHNHEPLLGVETSLKDRLQKKIDENTDFQKREGEADIQKDIAMKKLDRELESRKMKSLIEYKKYLDEKGKKVKDQLEIIWKKYSSAMSSITYFKENVEKDKFGFLLNCNAIRDKLSSVYMDGSEGIPGTVVSLANESVGYPLGSLKTAYCSGNSCKNFRFDLPDELIEVDVAALQSIADDLANFIKLRLNDDEEEDAEKGIMAMNKIDDTVNTDENGNNPLEENHDLCNDQLKQVDDKDTPLVKDAIHICQHIKVPTTSLNSVKNTLEFCFQVNNVSKVYDEVYSDPVVMGNYIFKILFESKGYQKVKYADIYLGCFSKDTSARWPLKVDAKIALKSQSGAETRSDVFDYEKDGMVWGWSFVKWSDLSDATKGYLVNDTVTIETIISCTHVCW